MNLSFLSDYVQNKKSPTFNEFVNNNLENIIAASCGLEGKTPDLLFAKWRREFALELNKQNKDSHIHQKKIVYNEQKWVGIKDTITGVVQTRLRYQAESTKVLADTASFSRRILTLANQFTDETSDLFVNDTNNNPPIDDATNDPAADDTTNSPVERAHDTIDDNDGFSFAGADNLFDDDRCEFQLHRLTYKKLINRQSLTKKEILFLENLKYDGQSIKGALQQFVANNLLLDNLSATEEEAIKLHLSGIVNLIHPEMSLPILSSLPEHLKTKLNYTPKLADLDPDTLESIERIICFHSDIDGIIEYIMVTKAALVRQHQRNSPQYINLAIIEQMVNNIGLWSIKRDESEATFYRRFAAILDTLLANTGVILADGETGLQSSKVAVAMNKAVFHTGDLSQAYGRKIDLILKCSSNVKVELSSNEWKKTRISKSIKTHQQSKNLRLNTCNLISLNNKFGTRFTVAMDFVGNSGYLYLLRLVDDDLDADDNVTVAHLLTDLVIPTNIESLVIVKDTLRGLLTLKNYLVDITWKVKSELHKLEHASVLEDICPTTSTGSRSQSPFILFTPKSNRIQKRKLFELGDDDDDDNDNDNDDDDETIMD